VGTFVRADDNNRPWWARGEALIVGAVAVLAGGWAVRSAVVWWDQQSLLLRGLVTLVGAVLAIGTVVSFAIVLGEHLGRQEVSRRMPRKHRGRLIPGQRLFLGWGRGFLGRLVPQWGRPNDSALTIAISGSGKSDGQATPQALLWAGSAILASTKWPGATERGPSRKVGPDLSYVSPGDT
jgi:hypothetical protein